MKKHPSLTIQRIAQFTERFQKQIRSERVPLAVAMAGPVGRIPHGEVCALEFHPVEGKVFLEPLWATFWFRLSGEVPQHWRERPVDLLFHGRSEAQLWIAGEPMQGLNFEGALPGEDGSRIDARLPENLVRGGRVELEVEAACNGLNGSHEDNRYLFSGAELALFNQEAWDIFHDLLIPSEFLSRLLRPHNPGMPWLGTYVPGRLTAWQGYLLERMNDICNIGDAADHSTWPAIRKILAEIYSHKNATYAHEISALGHCHIDTAWLWPLAETKRKCARSFSTALAYMKRYPDYKFACSQAHQYQWMKDFYPTIYEGIKEAVKRGQWIPVGGTWIEPDCNLPSGESLVRQFLYGKRFFREEFGWDCKEFWNPDGFGYSGALPQIIQGVGMKYFLTPKLFWNQFNKPQHQNFLWRGIDGSEVLTHFPPAENYTAMIFEKICTDLLAHEEGYGDHDRANEGLLLYGFGDGGGGPTTHMLEIIRRVADFQGIPRTQNRDSETFFKRLEQRMHSVPVVEGELYLEVHRGTYTTQAANKRGNRKSETLLRSLEILSAVASRTSGRDYPSADLERLWKLLLLNQFHDILPGSSITEVHEESRADYARLEKDAQVLIDAAAGSLGGEKPEALSLINLCGWERRGLAETPLAPCAGSQETWCGTHLTSVAVPACGIALVDAARATGDRAEATASDHGFVLENDSLRAGFSSDGRMVSLIEKSSKRQVLANTDAGSRFVLFEDRPVAFEAWDVEAFHLEKPLSYPAANKARILERGPLRAALEFSYAFGPSTMIQRVFLAADSRHLEFACEVNWQHRNQFLKVEFPVQVHSQEATYEIQFGSVKRPTHSNTSQDMARFEVSAHRWIDLSEPDFGVSLFTDCKYGYAVLENMMRISLLRGTESPDPTADLGHHAFRYAIYPHPQTLIEAEVVRRAYEFNTPWIPTGGHAPRQSWFSVDSPHLVIDSVKKAEDSDALIVRLYECHGVRGEAVLHTTLPCRNASLTNLMEEPAGPLALNSGQIPLAFTPFQILTVLLEF